MRARRFSAVWLLAVGCAGLRPGAHHFPEEHVVYSLRIHDGGALPGTDVRQEVLLGCTPGSLFDPYEWQRDQERILAYYRSRGFPQATMVAADAWLERRGVALVCTVETGPPLIVRSLKVEGAWVLGAPRVAALLGVGVGERADVVKLDLGKARIRAALAEEGYAHALVEATVVPVAGGAEVEVRIREGPLVHVGDVSVQGLKRVKPLVVTAKTELRPGKVFKPRDAYATQRALLGTGLFSSVRLVIPGMDTGEETLRVFIHVREAPPRFVESGMGFSSPDKATFAAAVGHQNAFGLGVAAKLRAGTEYGWATNRRQHTLEASTSSPFLGPLPVEVGVSGDFRWRAGPNARWRSVGLGVEMGKAWRQRASAFLRYRTRWRSTSILGPNPSEYVLEESRRPITNSLGATVSVDTRSSITDPQDGHLVRIQVVHAGGILGGDWPFRKLTVDFSTCRRVRGVVLAGRVSAGVARPLEGVPTVPEEERLRAGGATTVRGFPEEGLGPRDSSGNPLGGEAMVVVGAEVRVPVRGPVGWAGFMDAGQVWRRWRGGTLGDVEPAVGMGVRYATVIGPLRCDWGVPLRGGRHGRVHITLGHAF